MATDRNNLDAPNQEHDTAILTGYSVNRGRRSLVPDELIRLRLDYNLDMGENEYLPKTLFLEIPLRDAEQIHRDLSVALSYHHPKTE